MTTSEAKYIQFPDMMAGEHVLIRKFNASAIKHDSTICIYGQRTSGKTELAKYLAQQGNSDAIRVVHPTEHITHSYADITSHITSEFDPTVIEYLRINCTNSTKFSTTLVYDDCMLDFKDQSLRSLFMNSRHMRARVMCTAQHALVMDPTIRANTDYVCVFASSNLNSLKQYYNTFGDRFPSFEAFRTTMRCLGRYEFLVIANNSTANCLEDSVFWGCVPIVG
jgi:hypothetical protein